MPKLSTRRSWLREQPRFWQYAYRSRLLPVALHYRQLPREQRGHYQAYSRKRLIDELVAYYLSLREIRRLGFTEARLRRRFSRYFRFELLDEHAGWSASNSNRKG